MRPAGSASADVRVRAFGLLAEGRMSPTLAADLARLRQEQQLTREAWVTIWGLRSVHQFLRLPPGATEQLEALSLREAQHELSALEDEAGPVSVARMIAPDVKVGTHRRREVSLTAVPEAEVARQIQPLVDAGFDVRGVCTPAMALTALARLCERTAPGATAAYVALEPNAMCLAIVRDGVLLFSRETPWESLDSATALGDRLADELRRSLMFFRQSFRAVVERIVLCGAVPNLRALTSSTSAALNVPVETLDSLNGIDAEAVPEPADTFRASVPALWPAMAIASEGDDQPNLLATATRAGGMTRRYMAGLATVVVALIVSAWYFFASSPRDDRVSELARLEQQVARLEQEVQRASQQPQPNDARPRSAAPAPTPRVGAATARPDLVVSSILYSQQRRLAIINGRIVSVGDRIESSTILYIEPRAVTVRFDDGTQQTFALNRR